MKRIELNALPKYQSHKVVGATRITGIEPEDPNTGKTGVLTEHGRHTIERGQTPWPQGDGYLVVYEDGSLSFSPAQAFEAGYSAVR